MRPGCIKTKNSAIHRETNTFMAHFKKIVKSYIAILFLWHIGIFIDPITAHGIVNNVVSFATCVPI